MTLRLNVEMTLRLNVEMTLRLNVEITLRLNNEQMNGIVNREVGTGTQAEACGSEGANQWFWRAQLISWSDSTFLPGCLQLQYRLTTGRLYFRRSPV